MTVLVDDRDFTPGLVEQAPMIHICHTPMRVYSQRPDGERWCFKCRKRASFTFFVRVPTDPDSYYGPSPSIECERGHFNGDLFPGWVREWGDE